MKLIETIKKKIALRRERKAIMKRISTDANGVIHIEGSIVVHGNIYAKGIN